MRLINTTITNSMRKKIKRLSRHEKDASLCWLLEYFLDPDRDDDLVRDWSMDDHERISDFISRLKAEKISPKTKTIFDSTDIRWSPKFPNATGLIEWAEMNTEDDDD